MLKWLIVEFMKTENGGKRSYALVSERSLLAGVGVVELHTGKMVSLRRGYKAQKAHVVMVSEDRHFLEEQLKIMEQQQSRVLNQFPQAQHPVDLRNYVGEAGGPVCGEGGGGGGGGGGGEECQQQLEVCVGGAESEADQDFSRSASDWDPQCTSSSDSDQPVLPNKQRRQPKQYAKRTSQKPRPSLRAELPQMKSSPTLRTYSQKSIEQQTQYRPSDSCAPKVIEVDQGPRFVMTFDQQSQTELSHDVHNMTGTITMLQGEIQRLNQIIVEMQSKVECMTNAMGLHSDPFDSNYSVREETVPTESTQRCNPVLVSSSSVAQNHYDPLIGANDTISRNQINTPLTRNGSSNVVLSEMNKNRFEGKRKRSHSRWPTSQEERTTERANSYGSDADNEFPADMVPIGSGKTIIPRHVYAHIDWNSYTMATRKLLMAVFPRRTLATHSLTGKASPAFTSKPAKLQLDIKKVSDIVMSVVENCGVREGLVRSCITTKCADENKMYNMRLKKKANKKKAGEEIDRENSPPLRARGTEHGARQ